MSKHKDVPEEISIPAPKRCSRRYRKDLFLSSVFFHTCQSCFQPFPIDRAWYGSEKPRHVRAVEACPPLICFDLRKLPTTPASLPTTMCRYAFSLHGTCRHQVAGAVVEYCEKAVAPATAFPRRLREYHIPLIFLFSSLPLP